MKPRNIRRSLWFRFSIAWNFGVCSQTHFSTTSLISTLGSGSQGRINIYLNANDVTMRRHQDIPKVTSTNAKQSDVRILFECSCTILINTHSLLIIALIYMLDSLSISLGFLYPCDHQVLSLATSAPMSLLMLLDNVEMKCTIGTYQ